MCGLKNYWPVGVAGLLMMSLITTPCSGQFLDYGFAGVITEVTENENNVIPGLAVGDSFTGEFRFNSQGWHNTAGRIAVQINDVDLLFEGDSIFGGLSIDPVYSFRIVGDQAGFGADIGSSTFSASNFGVTLEDTDNPLNETGLPTILFSSEYETNEFTIAGTVIASGDRVNAVGRLTSLIQVVFDCFGDVDGDFDTDVDDINRFADVLGESALFHRCFEQNGDGVITLDDRDVLIETAVEISTSDLRGTYVGDINFDGRVDVLGDAFILVANLGSPGPFGYQDGDLNADNRVDVLGDAFRLVQNLGNSIQ